MKDGYHEVNLPDGARFEGEVRNGMPNGRGIFTLPDGGVLKGEFKDALLHGLGVNVYPEGNPFGVERQEGEFIDGNLQTGIQWTFGDPFYFENGTYISSAQTTGSDEKDRLEKRELAKEKAMLATKTYSDQE